MIKFRNLLKFFVSLLLLFSIILMQLSLFVNLKVLNGNFYKNTLNKNDYFSLMRKDINFGFKNLSMITSIPEELFISSVSDEAIKQLAYKNINNAEDYMKYNNKYINDKIDTKMIDYNLQNYVQKDNIKVDANLKNQLLVVSEDAGNIISNYGVLFNISVVDKYPQFQSFRKYIYLLYSIKIVSIANVLLMATLLIFLNRRSPRKMFFWIGSTLIPTAIISLVPCVLAFYYEIPNRFSIDSAYLKVALRDISVGYINYFIITGVIVLLIGICCMWIYTYLSNKAYSSHEEGIWQRE